MASNNYKLSINNSEEICVIGISTTQNNHRMAWAINLRMSISLSRTNSIKLTNTINNEVVDFEVFMFNDELNNRQFRLIDNKNKNTILLKKYKNADFLILIKSNYSTDFIKNFITELAKTTMLQIAFEIDFNQLTSKEKSLLLQA